MAVVVVFDCNNRIYNSKIVGGQVMKKLAFSDTITIILGTLILAFFCWVTLDTINQQKETISALQDSLLNDDDLPAWVVVPYKTPAFFEFYGDSIVLENCKIQIIKSGVDFNNVRIISRPSP
jgi:hypothetical protein